MVMVVGECQEACMWCGVVVRTGHPFESAIRARVVGLIIGVGVRQ